jgi:mRNA interferase MazF
VPLTDWKDRYQIAQWMVKVVPDKENKLSKDSSADCFQIRSVAEERLIRRVGTVSIDIMEKIRKAFTLVLSIE